MKTKLAFLVALTMAAVVTVSCNKENGPVREAVSNKDTYQQAYIYGFPMLMNYGVMYMYFVDRAAGQNASDNSRRNRQRLKQRRR